MSEVLAALVAFVVGFLVGKVIENERCAKLMETHLCDLSKSTESYDALPLIKFKQGWATPGMKGRATGIRKRRWSFI